MCSIIVAQCHMSLLHLHDWKKVQLAWPFFLLLANDDIKINKTWRIFTKVCSEPGSLSELDAINFTEWNIKIILKICFRLCKVKEKDQVMVNLYAMFQIGEAVGPSQMLFKIGVGFRFW